MVTGMGRVTPRRYRFGRFELDAGSGVLRRSGVTLPLQGQPLQVLLLLLERAGDVVTREELRRHVWQDETFVDFDQGLNAIVKRLRETLGDAAERPVFIQTLPRRGYRFLAPVEAVPVVDEPGPPSAGAPLDDTSAGPRRAPKLRRTATWILFIGIAIAGAAATYAFRRSIDRRGALSSRPLRLAVLPFENLTGSQDQQFFVDGLHEELIVRLGRMQPRQLTVIARTSVMPYREAPKGIAAIGRELGVDFVLEGSVRQAGDRIRVTAQLIHADDQSHLWTETYDRSWDDVFAIQSDVGARVADSLAVELLPSAAPAAAVGRATSPRAYEQFLKGRFYWNQRGRDPS